MIRLKSMVENLAWNYTADEIISKANKLIESTNLIYDDIGAIPLTEVNFNNVLKKVADIDCGFAVSRLVDGSSVGLILFFFLWS